MAGRVADVGDGVDPAWVGRRVTGDTVLGHGTCRRGAQHVCASRQEVGILGRPGALAEQLPSPRAACTRCRTRSTTWPTRAVELVEPAGRVVLIGLAGTPSTVDTPGARPQGRHRRRRAVGVLSASPALAATVEA